MLVAAGLLPGLVLAYVAGRSLQTLLIGVTPADLPTFAAVTGLTLLMALAGHAAADAARAARGSDQGDSSGVAGPGLDSTRAVPVTCRA